MDRVRAQGSTAQRLRAHGPCAGVDYAEVANARIV